MGKWSTLPVYLLDLIDGYLEFVDKVRVRAVCVSWNSYFPNMPKGPKLEGKQLPWLLQAFENNDDASHGLFSLIEKKNCPLHLEIKDKFFKGSSYVWVVTFEGIPARNTLTSGSDIHLFNLLTRAQIQLPPRHTFPDVKEYQAERDGEEYVLMENDGDFYFNDSYSIRLILVSKIVLSSPPSSDDCVVVAICGEYGRLAWCKLNDKKWTPLENSGGPPRFQDVIFHNNKLHALNCRGKLLVFDSIGPNPEVKEIAKAPFYYATDSMYLVKDSENELIMVCRYVDLIQKGSIVNEHTECFKVYKHDPINFSWVKVNTIGDDMLFLGFNSSLAISSVGFPGYKGNRMQE
ncbi:hypothetical protein LguiB_032992 [Lonicera macranthoides]